MNEKLTPADELPRRDRWLLPLVVLSVLAVFFGTSEVVASLAFAERGHFSCESADDRRHLKPNCVANFKNAEGPDVEYRFNECAYRSSKSCGPKAPGTVRIVVMGTSTAMGLYVPNDATFAARTENALSQVCRRPVDVQNMGAQVDITAQPDLVDEALNLSPDVIVLAVSPFDLQKAATATRLSNVDAQSPVIRIERKWHEFKLKARNSRLALAFAHFALMNEQVLYQVFLKDGGSRAVMSVPPTPVGERRYSQFATILDRMMVRLHGAGVPVIVLIIPNRVAAAMVSNGSRLEGIDPWWFGRHMSEIAVQHNALAVDVTPKFVSTPHAERLFYAVDNHPTAEAHAIIAQGLIERLTDGSIPQMAACHVPQP